MTNANLLALKETVRLSIIEQVADNSISPVELGNIFNALIDNLDVADPYRTLTGNMYKTQPEQTSGTLIVGKSYNIYKNAGDDFSNVGYVSDGVFFVATATTPLVWTNLSYCYRNEMHISMFKDSFPSYTWTLNDNNNKLSLLCSEPVFTLGNFFVSTGNAHLGLAGCKISRMSDTEIIFENISSDPTKDDFFSIIIK